MKNRKIRNFINSVIFAAALALMTGTFGGITADAASISLANGAVTNVAEVDGLETTITGRVIVASQSVNVGTLSGSVYCVAQPGIRVYEYMMVNYGDTTYSLIQYGTDNYAFTVSSAWYVEGTTASNATSDSDAIADQIAKVAEEKSAREYMYGRFTIPSVGIDVAIFARSGDQTGLYSWRQSICDATDSAVFYSTMYKLNTGEACSMSEHEWILADHINQDFANLINVEVGDLAYINDGNTITEYQCVRTCDGINNGHVYDSDGNQINYLNAGGFVTYTCKSVTDSYHVTMCFWQPVTE